MSLAGLNVAVVIPAYRAESTIAHVVGEIPHFVDTIVVVDDASPDSTSAVCSGLLDPRLVLLRHQANQGVGGAMVTGFRAALGSGADVIAKIDADGQMDPRRLRDLIGPLVEQGFDYAKANRFYDLTALGAMPVIRRWGNVALSFLTKLASGYWNVYDPQNGFLAIARAALCRLNLDALDRGYFFENSVLIQLNVISARVADVPIPARYGQERSSMDLKRVLFGFPWRLLGGWAMRMRRKYFGMDFSPVAALLGTGAALLAGGVGYGAFEWVKNSLAGVQTSAGTVMLAALPILLGIQFLLNALLLDISQTPPGLGIHRISGGDRSLPAEQGSGDSASVRK